MSIFVLSIEETEGHSYQHGFHLGTEEKIARQIVEEKFKWRVDNNLPILTMALKRNGKLFDVFYGDKWESDLDVIGEVAEANAAQIFSTPVEKKS
jgi:hypothetical protein